MVLDASAMRCMASDVSEMVLGYNLMSKVCQDSLGELSYSLSGMRKELHKWETDWREVFINYKSKSSTFERCQKRELCGLVHDRFIVESDSVKNGRVSNRGSRKGCILSEVLILVSMMVTVRRSRS